MDSTPSHTKHAHARAQQGAPAHAPSSNTRAVVKYLAGPKCSESSSSSSSSLSSGSDTSGTSIRSRCASGVSGGSGRVMELSRVSCEPDGCCCTCDAWKGDIKKGECAMGAVRLCLPDRLSVPEPLSLPDMLLS
eukprot:99188-Pelagomonas_calceolata.AAC.1